MGAETFDIRVTLPSTISVGRHTLLAGLREWGCSNGGDVVLVFSELVTNAAMHTAAGSTTVVTHGPSGVRLAVHDVSHSVPQLRHDDRPGGFGLRIVSRISDGWGWEQTATGKVVWSNVPCGH